MSQRQRIDWTGRELRLRVEGPAHGGEFVARHEGRVVFCRGGITGEVVDVLVDDDPGRAFCRGTVVRVLEPTAERIDPLCPAAAAGAGCCDWSHIDPSAARGFAGVVLADQVRRIGSITTVDGPVPVDPPAGDETPTGWRTVARWFTGPEGAPGVRRARSHEIVTEPCTQPDPRITEAVEATDLGPGREILGVLGDDGTVHVAHRPAVGGPGDTDARAPRRGGGRGSRRGATRNRARHARAGAWETVSGPATVTRHVGSRTWEIPPGAFWQAHRSAAGHYSDSVGRAVANAPGLGNDPCVWDLYAGVGLFTAATLGVVPGARPTLVESSRASVGAARASLAGDGGAVRVVTDRVEAFLGPADAAVPGERPDVVVLDPPRGGAGVGVMSRLAGVTRSRIIHVGCDAASLARDVGVLVDAGWRLQQLRGVAAFPGTHHVEGLAVLDSPTTAEGLRDEAVD